MSDLRVAAVVLAAGESKRMGRPKMSLPWGHTTVIGQVVETLGHAGLDEIVVVAGGARGGVPEALSRLPASLRYRLVFNPGYASDEMVRSLQLGLGSMLPEMDAAMVVLGDQPQMEAATVQDVLGAYKQRRGALVVPSYQMRRGHPWIVVRSLWPAIQSIRHPKTLRTFLQEHAGEIDYVLVDRPSILKDLDTPDQYLEAKPAG